ncbi:zinc knuckle [Ostertagia ostertagi]
MSTAEQEPMKRSAKPISSEDKTPLPPKQSKSVTTVAVYPFCPEGRSYRPRQHPALIQSGSKSPLRRPYRDRTPFELISELAKGNFNSDSASYEDDDALEDHSVPPSQRLSLRIAQSLTLAANYDHTFSVEQLAARDFVMIDAFLRHNTYDGFRDAIAEATYTPTPADLNYPPVKKYTVYLLVQAYKALHTAIQKSKSLITDLSTHSEYWKSEEKLAELYEDLLALLYNIQTHRNTLSDLIIQHVLIPIEDNKEFVDILAHYNITINYIKLICATATAETATGFLTLKKINSAIARLHNITLESSLPAESIDHNDIPTVEGMRAVTGGPVPISPTPLEPETKSIPKPAPASTSTQLHIRSSTSVTTTAHSSTPQHVTVSVAPNDSLSASVCSSSQDRRSTRTVRTVRAVAVSRSPSAHSDKRKQKPAKESPSPSSSCKQSPRRQEKQPTPDLVCHFCKATGAHFSAGCPNIKSLSDRAITAVSDGKCLHCLKKHSPRYCRRDTPCLSRSPSAHSDKRKQKPAKKSPSPSSSRKQSQEKQPTPDLVCHFCKATGAHFSAGCPNIKSLSDRAITAVSDGKCLYCLKAHSPGYCKRDIPCRLCDSTEHHPALCPYSHYIVRDIGPDVDKFFSAMYVIYENYHRHH